MRVLDVIAAVLVIVGALNWGLIALARFDLVAALFGVSFGQVTVASAIVYGLVGLAGIYLAAVLISRRHRYPELEPVRAR
jgi:uncharacterized protein